MSIKNYEETVEKLAAMLESFDKKPRPYVTKVHLYLSGDGVATLCECKSAGGNSWITDDSSVIYEDVPFGETLFDHFNNCEASDFAEILNTPAEELLNAAAKFSGLDDGEIPDWCDIVDYLQSDFNYMAVLQAVYEDSIDKMHEEYYVEYAKYLIAKYLINELWKKTSFQINLKH